MVRYMAEQSDSSFLTDVFKIALGVFIGGLLAALAYTKYMAWEMERSLGPALSSLNRETQRMSAESARQFQQFEQQRQQREAVHRIEQDQQADQARQRQLQQQAEAERDARRQAAWERYYHISPLCMVDSSTVARD